MKYTLNTAFEILPFEVLVLVFVYLLNRHTMLLYFLQSLPIVLLNTLAIAIATVLEDRMLNHFSHTVSSIEQYNFDHTIISNMHPQKLRR